ncbi:MAG: hypothetical protein Q7S58_01845 [Candidatus Binatus sp.]|nr:hypothetical protein [Candidatus Binatus sp.]
MPALERVYHELSRKIHPDRFASSAAAIRDASLRGTALLTRSYRTLRDPVARGLYWLELRGEKLAENNKRVSPDLAEMVFDVQEQIAELRGESPASDSFWAAATQLIEKRTNIQELMDASRAELERNFAVWDEGKPDRGSMLTLELKAILSKIAYLRTLLRDVDSALESIRAA